MSEETPLIAEWTVHVSPDGIGIDTELDYMKLHFWMTHVLRDLEDQYFEQVRQPVN